MTRRSSRSLMRSRRPSALAAGGPCRSGRWSLRPSLLASLSRCSALGMATAGESLTRLWRRSGRSRSCTRSFPAIFRMTSASIWRLAKPRRCECRWKRGTTANALSVRAVIRHDDMAVDDQAGGVASRAVPGLTDVGVRQFALGYRAALDDGRATVIRHGEFDGRRAIWLDVALGVRHQVVIVDADTYRPLALRPGALRLRRGVSPAGRRPAASRSRRDRAARDRG